MSGSDLAETSFRALSHRKVRKCLLRRLRSLKHITQLSEGERYEIITIHIVQKYEFHRYAKYPTFQFKHGA